MTNSLTATAQTTAHDGSAVARVLLQLTWASVSTAIIERLDPDGVYREVRNADTFHPLVVNGSAVVYDHEMPLDVSISYRATANTGATLTSGSVSVASQGLAWISLLSMPSLGGARTIDNPLENAYPSRDGIFTPLGAEFPIAVYDIRGAATGTIHWQTRSLADMQTMRKVIKPGSPLVLLLPSAWGGDTWYIHVTSDIKESSFKGPASSPYRMYEMSFFRIDRPDGKAGGAKGQTWNDLKAQYATWDDLAATSKTWSGVAANLY